MSKSVNKAFLLIRLKKYLNPHENSCSKVISILITGNILHESSSAPQQHKSVQYNINGLLCTYTEMLRIQTYCNHILKLQWGFGGRGQHARIQDFLSVLFSPQLILQFTGGGGGGSNGFIAEKTILILYQGSRGVHYFFRGVLSNFFQEGGGGSKC